MTSAAHHLSFRVFCGLLAAFWTALIFGGAARLAVAAPITPGTVLHTTASPAPVRCLMCAAMARAGSESGMMPRMKCCSCAHGASCTCRCRPQPRPHTVAVLIWSPMALLPEPQASAFPASRPCAYPALSLHLCAFWRSPLPRPPRLL